MMRASTMGAVGRARLAGWVVALASVACQSDPSQLVVAVDSDLEVPDALGFVRARVEEEDGERISDFEFILTREEADSASGQFRLPLSFAVVPGEGGLSRPVIIVVEALDPDRDELFARRVRTRFIENRTLLLSIFLSRTCVSNACEAGTTCGDEGECVPVDVDPATLPDVQPGGEFPGGSRPDGGPQDPVVMIDPPGPYDFNAVPTNPNRPTIFAGQVVSIGVSVTNLSLKPLSIERLELTGAGAASFGIERAPDLPTEVLTAQTSTFAVRYEPQEAGPHAARLVIATNDAAQGGGSGEIAVVLGGVSSACPAALNTLPDPLADPGGTCVYDCRSGFIDVDGEPGCETACTPVSGDDLPDDDFVDENCDGVDGMLATSLFVAPSSGSDVVGDGTRVRPFTSIQRAVNAAEPGMDAVLVAHGTYAESVTLRSGVSIYGGYDASRGWTRGPDGYAEIEGGVTAVYAAGVAELTTLDRLVVRSATAAVASESSVGILVVDSGMLVIRNSTISSGAGAPGEDGSPGPDGAVGGPGMAGRPGNSAGSSGGEGGAGGARSCGGASGGAGGRGGHDQSNGNPGVSGTGVTGGLGGEGAGGCSTCDRSCAGGLDRGQAGAPGLVSSMQGAPGSNGAGGSGSGAIAGEVWVGSRGSDGESGGGGGGGSGGGGGGGGAERCFVEIFGDCVSQDVCSADRGGGGGGGGSGGCGGGPGLGGGFGGGSFGILAIDSTPLIERVLIRTGSGGPGGRGGAGGSGGAGGAPGAAGGGRDDSGSGGAGGRGASGGRGGSGGGGAGGISFCLYQAGAPAQTSELRCRPGRGGPGGPAPDPGQPGEVGDVFGP